MKLYYSPGASSLSAHIALREADRVFDLVQVDLRTHRTSTGTNYYDINPKGYVPTLVVDDREVLTEIPAILQYIADIAPTHQLAPPNGSFARYHLQSWLTFIGTELHKQFWPIAARDTPPPVQERARGKIAERLRYLADVLIDRGYLMGETFTVADCYLFAMLRWCERYEIDLMIWPNVQQYYERISERAAVRDALTAEGLIEHRRHARAG